MTPPGQPSRHPTERTQETVRGDRRAARASALVLAFCVGLLGLSLTLLASRLLGALDQERQSAARLSDVERILDALDGRLNEYGRFARTTAGLFAASERVSPREWARFMALTGVERLPGHGAVGVLAAPRLDPGRRSRQGDTAASGNFSVRFPVTYVAPESGAMAHWRGHDLLEGVAARDAIRQALATDDLVLSSPLRLSPEGADAGQAAGALIVMPVSGEARHDGTGPVAIERLDAVIAVPVSYGQWIDSVLDAWVDDYAVEVSDPAVGVGGALLTVAPGLTQIGPARALNLGGRRLNLRFFSLHPAAVPLGEQVVRVVGVGVSLLLALLTALVQIGRGRAESRLAAALSQWDERERRFEQVMAASSEGILEWTPEEGLVSLNSRANLILFGASQARKLHYRRLLRVLPRRERSVVLTAVRAHLMQRSPLDVEVSLMDRDGAARHLRLRGQAQWEGVGRLVRLTAALSDITERRRQEAVLRRTQAFQSRIIDAIPFPVIVKSADHRFVLCNQAASQFAGLSREALLSGSTHVLLPGQAEIHHAMDDEALASGERLEREFHVHLRDGTEGDVVITKSMLSGPDGGPLVLAALSDVTALRRAERELRAALAESDSLFRNSPLGMALISKHGVIRRVNAAFTRIVGRSAGELCGRRYRDITPARFHALDREKTVDALRQGAVTPYARAFLRPDGTEVPVVLSGAVVHGDRDEPDIWTVVEDLAERRAPEMPVAARDDALAGDDIRLARLRALADQAPVMIWLADAQLRMRHVSRLGRETLGLPQGGCAEGDWQERLHPDDREAVMRAVRHALATRTSLGFECRCRREDGGFVRLRVDAVVRYTEGGRFAGFIGCAPELVGTPAAVSRLREQGLAACASIVEALGGAIRSGQGADGALHCQLDLPIDMAARPLETTA
jgi:PAS domain S-box-containing protein